MRPYIFKSDRAEFPHGYLEWKPEVEEPMCYKAEYKTDGICTPDPYYCFCENYRLNQQAIERSRIAVSEELKPILKQSVMPYSDGGTKKLQDFEYLEGSDFTIRDGKAYPVEKTTYEFVEPKFDGYDNWRLTVSRLRAENEKLILCVKKLEEYKETVNDVHLKLENTRLKAENETMKQALEWIVVNSVFYRDAIKKAAEALETLK